MRKNIALLLALVMILSLVPMAAFADENVENPTTYTTGAVPTLLANGVPYTSTIRVSVKVSKDFNLTTVDDITGFVSLPRNVEADATLVAGTGWNIPEGTAVPFPTGRNFTIDFAGLGVATSGDNTEDVTFFIDFDNLTISDRFSGSEVIAEFEYNKYFRAADVRIARVVDDELTIMMEDIFFISDADIVNDIGAIRFTENVAGATENVELTLPRGFYWDERVTEGTVRARFGGSGTDTVQFRYSDNVDNIRNQYRTVTIYLEDVSETVIDPAARSSYWVEQGDLRIRVDAMRTPAKGDVVADVDGASPDEIVIARFGSYVATAAAREVRNLFAGQVGSIGRFEIVEEIAESLAARRTITLTLPVGVKWHVVPAAFELDDFVWDNGVNGDPSQLFTEFGLWLLQALRLDPAGVANFNQGTLPQIRTSDSEERGLEFVPEGNNIRWQFVDAERRTIRATVETESEWEDVAREGAILVFNRSQVVVAADFRGPIEVEVGGSAGATGTITLAEVKPAVEVTAASVSDVIVGAQNQPLANITITETAAGAAARTDAMTGLISLRIPQVRNAVFSQTPVAEVVDGDIMIERVWMSADRRYVHVQVQGESDEPSSIELSNLALTLDRTAPEGELSLEVVGDAIIDEVTWARYNFFENDVLQTVAVANVLDRAPLRDAEGAVVTFTIGQATYTVDGEMMTMDVAPFIMNDRTMVPVRYLEAVFGVQPVWNPTSRTVTVMYDGKIFEMAIGSNVLRVNGAPYMELDATVEIIDSRTFVPASRFARAMGLEYEWNQATQTATFYAK